jgi:hypothetical protein
MTEAPSSIKECLQILSREAKGTNHCLHALHIILKELKKTILKGIVSPDSVSTETIGV